MLTVQGLVGSWFWLFCVDLADRVGEEALLDYEQHDEVEAPVAAIPVQNAGCF